MHDVETPRYHKRSKNWMLLVFLASASYVLSSGPMIAICFWLSDVTDWEGFYAVIWFYYPLLCWGHSNPMMDYIEWWVLDVFKTVGPG